jgi:hypothetical protein
MTLQRRHFEVIASTIAGLDLSVAMRFKVAKGFADELAGTKPNFNRERFLNACKGN